MWVVTQHFPFSLTFPLTAYYQSSPDQLTTWEGLRLWGSIYLGHLFMHF